MNDEVSREQEGSSWGDAAARIDGQPDESRGSFYHPSVSVDRNNEHAVLKEPCAAADPWRTPHFHSIARTGDIDPTCDVPITSKALGEAVDKLLLSFALSVPTTLLDNALANQGLGHSVAVNMFQGDGQ